jgi:hypothetical protein
LVGGGKERSRIEARDHLHKGGIDTVFFQPYAIFFEILAHGSHNPWMLPQQCQGIGNVGGNAAKLARHGIDQEGQADFLQPLRQDLLLEHTGEGHQVIERHRTSE